MNSDLNMGVSLASAIDVQRKTALLITYYYAPTNNGGVQRPLKMAKYLPEHGVDVVVVTTTSERGWCDQNGIVRVPDFTRQSHPVLYYPVRLLQKTLKGHGSSPQFFWQRNVKKIATRIVEKYKPDVVIATYPTVEALELGLFFSQKFNIPLIADFRDGLLFEPVGSARLDIKSEYERIKSLESKVVTEASVVLTVSTPITRYFEAEYHRENILTLPNGFDPDDVSHITPFLFESGKVNIVYTGRLSLSDRECDGHAFFNALLKVALSEIGSKVCFHFAGEISDSEMQVIKPLIECKAVKIYGLLPRERAIALQLAADILLLVTGMSRKSVATGKLYEYLAASRPILALTGGTAAEDIVKATGTGWIISPDDEKGIYDFLLNAVQGKLPALQRNEAEIAKYSRKRQAKFLAEIIFRETEKHGYHGNTSNS